MIRTRDFLLFALAFIFLSAGIASTVLLGSWSNAEPAPATVLFAAGEVPSAAEAVIEQVDYAENAERLRASVLAGAGDVAAGPPVFTSVDQLFNQGNSLGDGTVSSRAVSWCAVRQNDSTVLANWPRQVTVNSVEGARLFQTDGVTRLQLPVNPIQQPSVSCISGVVVGVTLDGQLIRNDEVFRYVAMSSEQQIGWALDGFPIYGTSDTPDQLDQCGGSSTSGSYRYHLRAGEDFVLACYAGVPATIK